MKVKAVKKKLEVPPLGAFCVHRRMKYVACSIRGGMCKRPCMVECPDCGLTWMFREGIYG